MNFLCRKRRLEFHCIISPTSINEIHSPPYSIQFNSFHFHSFHYFSPVPSFLCGKTTNTSCALTSNSLYLLHYCCPLHMSTAPSMAFKPTWFSWWLTLNKYLYILFLWFCFLVCLYILEWWAWCLFFLLIFPDFLVWIRHSISKEVTKQYLFFLHFCSSLLA